MKRWRFKYPRLFICTRGCFILNISCKFLLTLLTDAEAVFQLLRWDESWEDRCFTVAPPVDWFFTYFQLLRVNSNYRLELNTLRRQETSFFCTFEAEKVCNYIPGALPPHLHATICGRIPSWHIKVDQSKTAVSVCFEVASIPVAPNVTFVVPFLLIVSISTSTDSGQNGSRGREGTDSATWVSNFLFFSQKLKHLLKEGLLLLS